MEFPWEEALRAYGGSLIALLVLVVVFFVLRFRIGRIRASPDEALGYLSYKLRFARYRVAQTVGVLTVRIGPASAVKVRARGSDGETEITFRTDATPLGWSVPAILILLLNVWTGVLAISAILSLLVRSYLFARRAIVPLLPKNGAIPTAPQGDRIWAALVTGLSEAHRLAAETQEAERSAHLEDQAGVALGALLLWVIILIGLFTGTGDPAYAAYVASGAAAVFWSIGGWLVYRRSRPRLRASRAWVDRLFLGLVRETEHGPPEATDPSAFELLAKASREMPAWIPALRGHLLRRDPWTALVIVLAAWWGSLLVIFGVLATLGGSVFLAASIGLTGVALVAAAYAVSLRWKRRVEEEADRELAEWNRRFGELRVQMEGFLRSL